MGGGSAIGAILANQYNSAMDAVSWSTRSLIRAAPGCRLLAADFANIEGRVLALLAGEEWKLKAFRDYDTITGHDEKGKPKRLGPDLYLVAAGKILGKAPDAVTKPERQNVGKPAELGLGFGGGVGAILTMMRNGAVIPWMHRDGPAPRPVTLDDIAGSVRPAVPPEIWADAEAQYGRGAFETALEIMEQRRLERLISSLQGDDELPDDDDDEAQRLAVEIAKANRLGLSVEHWTALRVVVDLWRQSNSNIAAFWRASEDAAKAAIRAPGSIHSAGAHVRYCMSGDVLYCRLPSGRTLAYPYARLVKPKNAKDDWKGERIQYLRRVIGRTGQWIWKDTYGGSLVENSTQATARDVLRDALLRLRRARYQTILHVHDEIICEMPEGQGSLAELCEIMREVPQWASGLPIAVEGFEGLRYKK